MPRYGCINLHVSLLPKISRQRPRCSGSVLNVDAETGVSIMQMDEGLDTGVCTVTVKKSPLTPRRPAANWFDPRYRCGAPKLCV